MDHCAQSQADAGKRGYPGAGCRRRSPGHGVRPVLPAGPGGARPVRVAGKCWYGIFVRKKGLLIVLEDHHQNNLSHRDIRSLCSKYLGTTETDVKKDGTAWIVSNGYDVSSKKVVLKIFRKNTFPGFSSVSTWLTSLVPNGLEEPV